MPCSPTLVLIFRIKSMRGKADLTASPPPQYVCVYAYILCRCAYLVSVDVCMYMFCASVYIFGVYVCMYVLHRCVYLVCVCGASLERSEDNLRYRVSHWPGTHEAGNANWLERSPGFSPALGLQAYTAMFPPFLLFKMSSRHSSYVCLAVLHWRSRLSRRANSSSFSFSDGWRGKSGA